MLRAIPQTASQGQPGFSVFCTMQKQGSLGICFSASVSTPCCSFIYKGAPMSFPFSVSWATGLKPRTWVHWNDLLVASGDIMQLVNSSKAKKKALTWFFFLNRNHIWTHKTKNLANKTRTSHTQLKRLKLWEAIGCSSPKQLIYLIWVRK